MPANQSVYASLSLSRSCSAGVCVETDMVDISGLGSSGTSSSSEYHPSDTPSASTSDTSSYVGLIVALVVLFAVVLIAVPIGIYLFYRYTTKQPDSQNTTQITSELDDVQTIQTSLLPSQPFVLPVPVPNSDNPDDSQVLRAE